MWNNFSMPTVRVDSENRIVLPNANPGDVYDVQQLSDGSLRLVRLEAPAPVKRMTAEECKEAMRRAPLTQTMTWEELRKITRDL